MFTTLKGLFRALKGFWLGRRVETLLAESSGERSPGIRRRTVILTPESLGSYEPVKLPRSDEHRHRERSSTRPAPPRRTRGTRHPAPRAADPRSTVILLHRRALQQLFEHFEIDMIPAEVWVAFDRRGDAVSAFREFVGWLGCDAEAVRRKETDELARLRIAAELQFHMHPIRQYISAKGLTEIGELLESSETSKLIAAAASFETLGSIFAQHSRSEELLPSAAYTRFEEMVKDSCQNPAAMPAAASKEDEWVRPPPITR